MLIYELEIGMRSMNAVQVEVECVDEADARETFLDLMNDLHTTDLEETYVLETDDKILAFMIKDVEYVRWEMLRDTHTESQPTASTWYGGTCYTHAYNPMEYSYTTKME